MPSLRKRVSSYLRQLSFHNEPRGDKRFSVNENSFVTKYLQGLIRLQEGPPVISGKTPTDLPSYELGAYGTGPGGIVGCYTGPNGGLTTVKRAEKHLSIAEAEIDFIDTQEENASNDNGSAKRHERTKPGTPIDNSTMVIKVGGQEYFVTNTKKHKSHSMGSLSDLNADSGAESVEKVEANIDEIKRANEVSASPDVTDACSSPKPDLLLPAEWNRTSDRVYGLSDSLYDRNLVTKLKNGDPIADCFGAIARQDSAILAVADGVNWGEKACVAAKSAVHGCLHYLNRTIFNDTKPFEAPNRCETPLHDARIANTRDVFVSLLRAFNCAHDLILENDGMLTTLTVAVVLPLKESPDAYVCCCCNVGDTLAYVYSQRYGVRELTKGSHDVSSNRDMRDALGALGPVDGINPELSNLTLSVTKVQRGDVVFVASDGLTDNFDPNVCRFAVNPRPVEPIKPRRETRIEAAERSKPPVKPPRKNHHSVNNRPKTDGRRPPSLNRTLSVTDDAAVPDARPPANHHGFLRSKTSVDLRPRPAVQRNADGLPYVTPIQRYDLTLLLVEDVLRSGISGREGRCATARRLCESLMGFATSVTAAKRRTLEDNELYFDSRNGLLVEVTSAEKKARRKRGLERVQSLPGKLDHVTVVAANVGDSSTFR